MKSLKESLFDSEKNITKDMTFGDLFELDEPMSSKSLHSPLSQEFSVQRLKRLVKVKGEDNDEIIYNGIVKLISDIKLIGNPEDLNKQWLRDKIQDFSWDLFRRPFDKYKSLYTGFSKNGILSMYRDISLLDTSYDTLQIRLGTNLNLVFRRK